MTLPIVTFPLLISKCEPKMDKKVTVKDALVNFVVIILLTFLNIQTVKL